MNYGLLGVLLGADMNTIADQQILLSPVSTPVDCLIKNASITLNNASDGKIFTGASQSGIQLFDTQISGGDGLQLLIYPHLAISVLNQTVTPSQLTGQLSSVIAACYFSLGIPEGQPATADIYIFGYTA